MSQPPRSATSSPSSPPSSATSKKEDRLELPDLAVRYAADDEDLIEIHRFLCIVAQPVLFCQINAQRSVQEIGRIIHGGGGFALMAELNGHLVGTMGVVRVPWWYGAGDERNPDDFFLTDRWLFALPQFQHAGVGTRLVAEAAAAAHAIGNEIIINGHMRRRGNGLVFTRPHVPTGTKEN